MQPTDILFFIDDEHQPVRTATTCLPPALAKARPVSCEWRTPANTSRRFGSISLLYRWADERSLCLPSEMSLPGWLLLSRMLIRSCVMPCSKMSALRTPWPK